MNRRTFLTGVGSTMVMLGCAATGATNLKSMEPKLTTKQRHELALKRFQEGYHCSQCTFEPYAADLGISVSLARKLSAPLAGGTVPGGECGAIGSGYLILGARFGRVEPLTPDGKGHEQIMNMYGRIHRFVGQFEARHGAISCADLTGVNVFSPGERADGRKHGAFDNCDQYICDAISLIDQLMLKS